MSSSFWIPFNCTGLYTYKRHGEFHWLTSYTWWNIMKAMEKTPFTKSKITLDLKGSVFSYRYVDAAFDLLFLIYVRYFCMRQTSSLTFYYNSLQWYTILHKNSVLNIATRLHSKHFLIKQWIMFIMCKLLFHQKLQHVIYSLHEDKSHSKY